MKSVWKIVGAGHGWRWWVLYAVPLIPLFLLVQLLFPGWGVWHWVAWGFCAVVAMTAASRLERYWGGPR